MGKIVINEEALNHIITESVKRVLNEMDLYSRSNALLNNVRGGVDRGLSNIERSLGAEMQRSNSRIQGMLNNDNYRQNYNQGNNSQYGVAFLMTDLQNGGYKCSKCGAYFKPGTLGQKPKYCPNCGAEFKGQTK